MVAFDGATALASAGMVISVAVLPAVSAEQGPVGEEMKGKPWRAKGLPDGRGAVLRHFCNTRNVAEWAGNVGAEQRVGLT